MLMESVLRSKLLHCAVAVTSLIWLFEYMPVNSTARLTPSGMIGVKARQTWERFVSHTPSWLGLWSVYRPKGEFHSLAPHGEEIRHEAHALGPYLHELQKRTFFRIFKINLQDPCPFWARENLCVGTGDSSGWGVSPCTVCECDESQIPRRWLEKPTENYVEKGRSPMQAPITPWDQTYAGNLEGPAGAMESVFLNEMSGKETNTSTYVDLSMNPPGYTNYRGRNIWALIYRDNCLRSKDEVFNLEDSGAKAPECSEEDVYERMISGLQTAVMVLASEYNQPVITPNSKAQGMTPPKTSSPSSFNFGSLATAAAWYLNPMKRVFTVRNRNVARVGPDRYRYNLDLYRWRVNSNPAWVDNLYFNFSMIARTVARLAPIIQHCGCYTGTDADDQVTQELLAQTVRFLTQQTASGSAKFSQMPIFQRKQELAIDQMHNISKVFDCIDCEKCRLHGKVKLTALQVAVKTLGDPHKKHYQQMHFLERNEITALINALAYYQDAIRIVEQIRLRVNALRRILLTATLWIFVALCAYLNSLARTHTLCAAAHGLDPGRAHAAKQAKHKSNKISGSAANKNNPRSPASSSPATPINSAVSTSSEPAAIKPRPRRR